MGPVESPLLPRSLRSSLPSIDSVVGCAEPWVYAHYTIPDRDWSYYVTGGQPVPPSDYAFWGFLMTSIQEEDWAWREVTLRTLETLAATLDTTFTPGPLTDTVHLPLN